MKAHDDDILEHALNFGVKSSAKRFDVSEDKVKQVVLKFKLETDLPCPCEVARSKGFAMMCMHCPNDFRYI